MARRMDEGQRYTEDEYARTIKKLRGIYKEAASDLRMKMTSFQAAHKKRMEKYRAMVERGELTEADYRAWMRGQLFQEQAWKQRVAQISESMAEVDANALRVIHSGRIRVFAENANYLEFEVEKRAGAQSTFGLYDDHTVSRLIRDEPTLLPPPQLDEGRDVEWYNRMIGNAVTQGIIQGEDLDGIVFRVSLEVEDRALAAMRRNCRTAYTGAQNAGRLEGMRQAEQAGIQVKKRWIATLDSHTRNAHQALDGQTVDRDEPFHSPLGDIMYPGDPDAEPGNVYNCRCTLGYVYPKYDQGIGRRRDEDGQIVSGMTYDEWKRWKAGQGGGGGDAD